jgi:hypothetical protein
LRGRVLRCHLVRVLVVRHSLRDATELLGHDPSGLQGFPLALVVVELLLRSLLRGSILIHDDELSLFYLVHRNLRLLLLLSLDALALMQLDQALLRRIRALPPEVVPVLVILRVRLKSGLGAIAWLCLLALWIFILLVRVEGFSALIVLNPIFLRALQLLQLLLQVLLHLGLVHVLDFFDDKVRNGRRTPIRVVIVVDVHIVIIYNLNNLGRVALTQVQLSQTHCFQLFLKLRVLAE